MAATSPRSKAPVKLATTASSVSSGAQVQQVSPAGGAEAEPVARGGSGLWGVRGVAGIADRARSSR
jgi:hypothetical protein